MKIAVLGSGAMGMLFGALLAEGGNDVTMICHRDSQAQAINEHGLVLTTDDKGTRTISVYACTASELKGSFDLVILFTKSHQSEDALESIKDFILAQDVTLLSLQNGIGNEHPLLEYAKPYRVLVGNTFMNSNRVSDYEIVSHGSGETAIMAVDEAGRDRRNACVEMFEACGLECASEDDAPIAIWRKVCFNSAMSPITAILRLNNGGIVDAGAKDMSLAVAHESVCVANALGIHVEFADVAAMLEKCWYGHRDHIGSMCADCLNGRPTDIDYLNGEIARLALDAGMTAPYNSILTEMVHALTEAQRVGCRLPEA